MRHHIRWAFAVALAAATGQIALFAAEPTAEQTAAMRGTWEITSLIVDGNMFGPDQIEKMRRVVKDNHVVWSDGDKTLLETDIAFDPTKSPMTLDSVVSAGDQRGNKMLAIYELRGDELRVCFGHFDKPRPTAFESVGGQGQSMFTARRVAAQ
ncbi:MAG: TIGR03067 domain-containing protein [Planctomycetales bacterium]|nr:TIGR03067 domain-containing protein [Planctomycetales bacterium]